MRLYLLRHAEAVTGTCDFSRELTQHGVKQVINLARKAGKIVLKDVDVIEHSPLIRATRTAELLKKESDSTLPLRVFEGIEPNSEPRKTAELLMKSHRNRLLVGHNPHLAMLTGLLLGLADGGEGVRFRKSSLMALERTDSASETRPYGSWRLLWMLAPDLV